jgi:hypothetical protein
MSERNRAAQSSRHAMPQLPLEYDAESPRLWSEWHDRRPEPPRAGRPVRVEYWEGELEFAGALDGGYDLGPRPR